MRTRSTLHRSLMVLALLAAVGCPGGDGDDEIAADEYFYDCTSAPAGVTVYATDESLREISDKVSAGAVTTNDAEAATVMSPAPGGTLSATTPPAFMLRTPTAALVPPGRGGCPPARRRWWQRLSPIGVAHAHCPGVTGDNMLVRVTPSGGKSADLHGAGLGALVHAERRQVADGAVRAQGPDGDRQRAACRAAGWTRDHRSVRQQPDGDVHRRRVAELSTAPARLTATSGTASSSGPPGARPARPTARRRGRAPSRSGGSGRRRAARGGRPVPAPSGTPPARPCCPCPARR